MADDAAPSSPKPDTPPPRTTGGNWRWEPPTAEELQALMPGYTIEKILGRGGMGAVYRGVQTNLDRPVAIKILPPGVEKEDPSFAERFKSEAKLMAKLNHPAVVSVYDFGKTSAGQLYFAMEYVDGSDVHQMIAAQGKLPPEHALAITAHVCDALAAAHELGIVHRDIKPANVLINMKGQVKVADFGLAKVEDPGQHGLTKTGYAMGTPDFVAPEALTLGTAIDGRADLYAVGVMLYQMLTGNIPRGAFKPASVLVPGLDPRFDPIITKAMQHDRAERHQSAMELRRELDVILTVPLVQHNAPASAAIPVAQMAQTPAQRSAAAQKPQGKAPQQQAAAANKPAGGHAASAALPPAKSKAPLFLGIGAVAAIGIGAFVMFGGKKEPAPPKAPPAVASASTPAPKPSTPPPSKPPPKPAPTVSSSPSPKVSSSPTPPASDSSEPEFPRGKWVKMFTKTDDLPEKMRASGSMTIDNGWILITGSKRQSLKLPTSVAGNYGVRARVRREVMDDNGWTLITLRESGAGRYSFAFKPIGIQVAVDGGPNRQVTYLFNRPYATSISRGQEYTFETAVVGDRLIVRYNDQIVQVAMDGTQQTGTGTISGIEDMRDIEVINLDGIPEAEALKILGVDEKGNDLRQKPAAVASATPAASSPTPAAAKSAMAPASSSPSLPISKSSDPKFPPGQWVKVFTKAEDLPENLRKPDSGVKFEDGWIIPTNSPNFFVQPTSQLRGNYALRCRVRRNPAATTPTRISIRRKSASEYYGIAIDDGGELNCTRRTMSDYSKIAKVDVPSHSKAAAECALEFGAIGPLLIARCDDSRPLLTRDSAYADGPSNIIGNDAIRDIEVINLDGLPEAEALRLLGVDEKGNDLRALAAKQEQQKAEMAQQADAMAAIPELKTLHEQFVKLQAERVTAPFEAEVAKLNAGYVGGIDREIANEKKAGHLDGVIALEAEKKLIADKQPVPAEDDEKTTEALKKLRGIYRTAYAKLEAARAENLKALTDPLSIRLKQLESTLTQQNRVPDAKVVREYREGLGRAAGPPAAAIGPASTNRANAALAGASALPKKKFPPGDDRKAAEWVLSVGGSVRIYGINKSITDVADLPRGRFELEGVYLEFTSTNQPKGPIDNLLPLAGLKGLRQLTIEVVPLTEVHWEVLSSLPALGGLWLESTGVTDALFAHLAGAKLRFLEIRFEPAITGEGIEALAAAKSLEKVSFTATRPSEEGLRQIGKLETLTTLSLHGSLNLLRDEHLPLLAGLKRLDNLAVRRTALTAEGLAGMKSWSDLPELGFDIRAGNGGAEVAVLAKAFPKVEKFSFEGESTWNYNADDVRALAGFPRLKSLNASNSQIDDEALGGLLALPKLEGLRISNCAKVTDAALATFGKHKGLTTLSFETMPNITDAGLTHLIGLKSLTRLELKSCPKITPAAIAAFKKERPDVTVVR
ncbi:serine/threonine-protein kinase [Prosthecobacter sp.]|uniref:serine/threonine-protein kinase n=1 Tax=Prosthecobacter sp. TaxID=1965333 RepID=UPI001D5E6AD3|nr:serine/threonine-protein kinase [Prosthecobacter sp.]MCB1276254.1 protein kinase [Prosthecobacter sp.]